MLDIQQAKTEFLTVLQEYTDGDDSRRCPLFLAYNTLTGSLPEQSDDRDQMLTFVFSALMDHLDRAPDGQISETLYDYTFRDFLEYHGREPAVRAAISDYLENRKFQKLPIYIALGRRLRESE